MRCAQKFDFDLSELYQVETRVLNQAVKRNVNRFPEDFMFRLSVDEWTSISSQFVMTSRTKRPKSALPFVFTEHGVCFCQEPVPWQANAAKTCPTLSLFLPCCE